MKIRSKLLALLLILTAAVSTFLIRAPRSKAFSGFTGGAAVLTVPVTVVADIPYSIKEQVEDVIVRSLARNAQTTLQRGVLERIRRYGRDGGPAFVQDWRQFLQVGQYRGEDVFRAILADATVGDNPTICPHLRQSLTNIFNAKVPVAGFNPAKYRVGSLQYFKIENRCTLPSGFDIEAFQKDFSKGGWAAWARLMEPQNNFFGLLANATAELGKQRAFEEQIDKSEAESGGGFTSKRGGCQGSGSNLTCVVLGEIKTPGQILEATVQRSIDEDFSWITSSDEFSELLAGLANSLFNSLVSKIENLASGELETAQPEEVFDPQACLDECVNTGYRVCDGREELETSTCRQEILDSCVEKCPASNTLP